jgi:hypothetical protein
MLMLRPRRESLTSRISEAMPGCPAFRIDNLLPTVRTNQMSGGLDESLSFWPLLGCTVAL